MGKILVAEDSRTIRTIVHWVCKGTPNEVIEATSGDEVLPLAEQSHPEVIVLDYTLPDVDSYDLCKLLKSSPATANIPVLMLGGAYANFDEGRAAACGADGWVTKPFKADDFLGQLDAMRSLAASGQVKSFAAAAPAAPPPQPAAGAAPPQGKARFSFPGRTAAPPPSGGNPRFSFPGGNKQQSSPFRASAATTPPKGMAAPTAQQIADAPPISGSGSVQIDEAILREEVQAAVKAMLPGIVRNVLKELITKEVTPQLQKWVEGKVEQLVQRRR